MLNNSITGTLSLNNNITGTISTRSRLNGNITSDGQVTGNIMQTILKGLSAYDIAVKNGYVGTEVEWLQSLVGDSVVVEVVTDTRTEYILSFTVGDEVTITPNLKPILVKGIDYLTDEDVEELTNDVTVAVKDDIDDIYQKKDSVISSTAIITMVNSIFI